MLDRMRAFASTFVARILIGVLIVGLSVWGISNVFVNLASTTVGRVGDQEISSREFQRAYISQVNAYAQQTGVVPTTEEARNLGIPAAVIQQLAASAALDGLAEGSGMGASETLIARKVAEDPNFSGAIGGFDAERFNSLLRQNGWTEAEYLGEQAGAVRREQLAQSLFIGLPPPQAMQHLVRRYQGDTRTIEYFTVNTTNIEAIPAATEDELAAYLGEHQAQYRTVETRTIGALVLTPEVYAGSLDIAEAEISAEYERTAAQYARPATRTIATLALPATATVSWFNLGLSAGKSFSTLLEESGLGEKVEELGTLAKDQIADAALADAAFGLEADEYGVLEGADGARAIYVSAADPGGQQSFEAVRDQVRAELALDRARDGMSEVIDQIEEARAALTPIADIAGRYGLTVAQATVDRTGGGLETVEALPEGARPQVAVAVFAADPDRLIPSIPLGSSATVWFDIVGADPARDLSLDEAREGLVAGWSAEKTEAALRVRAEELAARVVGGEPIADVAFELGAFSQISSPIGRGGDGLSISPSVAEQAFAGGLGHAGSARSAEGDYMVFSVTDIQPADPLGGDPGIEAALADALSQSVYGQFIARLVGDAGLRINDQVLNDILTNVIGTQ